MVRKTLSLIAFITALAAASGEIRAETISIFKATLAEENAKTGEVSTEQMRTIMDDNSAIILDTCSRAEFDAGHIPERTQSRRCTAGAGRRGRGRGKWRQGQSAGSLL